MAFRSGWTFEDVDAGPGVLHELQLLRGQAVVDAPHPSTGAAVGIAEGTFIATARRSSFDPASVAPPSASSCAIFRDRSIADVAACLGFSLSVGVGSGCVHSTRTKSLPPWSM